MEHTFIAQCCTARVIVEDKYGRHFDKMGIPLDITILHSDIKETSISKLARTRCSHHSGSHGMASTTTVRVAVLLYK
jgi:hypothetical protein